VLSGVVVDGTSDRPVSGALVYLGREGREVVTRQSRQLTDERGRFAFTDVPPSDRYSLSASKPGYFGGGYSRDTSPAPGSTNRLLSVAEGDWVGDARLVMWRPAAIGGTVVDEAGDPVVGVTVRTITSVRVAGTTQLADGPSARTDDRGMYRIANLAPGSYRVSVPSVQAAVPASTTTAAIMGRSMGAGSRPATATVVGRSPAGPGSSPTAVEHALDLDPQVRIVLGDGPVPPPSPDGRLLTYPIAFHGGASLAEAATVDLGYGDDRSGLDIQLQPVPAVRIEGRVDGPPDALAGLLLRLLPDGLEGLGLGGEAATTRVEADGRFVFVNVPAGRYVVEAPLSVNQYNAFVPFSLSAPTGPPGLGWGSVQNTVASAPTGTTYTTRTYGRPEYWGRTTVTAGAGGASNVVVPLRHAATMTGRIVAEGDPARPDDPGPAFAVVAAEPANGEIPLGRPQARGEADGSFRMPGLGGGRYILHGTATAGWIVKSIAWNGRDMTAAAFDASSGADFTGVVVTFTHAAPVLAGTVRDARGQPAADATVVAFPVERAQWTGYGLTPARIQSTVVANGGTYRFTSLPAGDYHVIAVAGTDPAVWQAPGFFDAMAPNAAAASLRWGAERSQDLQVAGR
jgi:hypothetical protein